MKDNIKKKIVSMIQIANIKMLILLVQDKICFKLQMIFK